MLGSILNTLEEVVRKRGVGYWESILQGVGLSADKVFFGHRCVDDELFDRIFTQACEELGWSEDQLSEDFGLEWMHFVENKYPTFFGATDQALDFLANMDRVHQTVTKQVEGARPPHFTVDLVQAGKLRMDYHSPRSLQHLWIGLVKAVGTHFNQPLKITRLTENSIEITERF